MLYLVALINENGSVIHTGYTEASDANAAIESERRWAQSPYVRAEAYDGYEEDGCEPLLVKNCSAPHGHFRMVV